MLNKFIPPGWTYNPSTFSQRIYIVILAFIGSAISLYLALFQYEVIDDVWEPFFGEGSRKILMSPTSFILPVSDAALGALAYLIDAITGIIGGPARWQKMPLMVIIFGFFVGPLSIVSIALVIAQPVLYHQWCTLCLVSAVISIIIVGPSMDEVLASLQYLKRIKQEGKSMVPFLGGRAVQEVKYSTLAAPPQNKFLVWPLWVCMVLSVLLIFSANVFKSATANIYYVICPLILTCSCIALWETTRSFRYLNIFWAVLFLLLLSINEGMNQLANMLIAIVIIILSLIPLEYRHQFDGGWKILLK
ncbi:MAG: vitamin K epoxide reductase family protein [Candidatus Omnitrophica bacterium]|nr:vitamin K epoxide reductase family protein [Candidatus Omnitrophota bacterium]